jgi:RNA polymerase sigma factor (sigma-70 family)
VTDDELVRRFARHRDAGERAAAKQAWEQIVLANFDRVETLVRVWRHPSNASVRIAEADVDDAVQRALVKFALNMGKTFRGASGGELRAALRRCVDYACRDVARAVMTHEKHVAGSIDERVAPERDAAGRFDRELGRLSAEEGGREEERREARDFVAAALSRITNETRRAVLEMTLDGVPAEEIAERLGVSLDVVYQHRTRGIKDLRSLQEEHAHGRL